MKVGLIDVDSKIPNLALMKIARYHRERGDECEFYDGFSHVDRIYMAKVFTYTPDYGYVVNADEVIKGGTGYDYTTKLPAEIDRLQPDYSLYPKHPKDVAMGFLTRGCPNKCKWCIVPKKEGAVAPYMDIDEVMIEGRNKAVLMDNNILASDYGLRQIEKIVDKGYRVDFNQALDARLVTEDIAKLLASVKWIRYIRFGCDTPSQITACERAMERIDKAGYRGGIFFTACSRTISRSRSRASTIGGTTRKASALAHTRNHSATFTTLHTSRRSGRKIWRHGWIGSGRFGRATLKILNPARVLDVNNILTN